MNKVRIVAAISMLAVLAACSPAAVPALPAVSTASPADPAVPAVASTAEATQIAAPIVPLSFPEIAFQGNRSGDNEIYAMNVDGSGQIDLSNNPANDINPVWSPDHTHIAFASDRDGNNEIYVMNADGSNQVNLSNNAADDHAPTWSPDGKQIAFFSNRGQIAGSNSNFGVASSGAIQVAYHSSLDASLDTAGTIYVTSADGSGEATVLVAYPADEPNWSPNGQQIAFTTNFFGGNGEIWVINPDGSDLKRISALVTGYAWSPDGKQIVVSSWKDHMDNSLINEIYVMNADGSNPIQLTTDGKKNANPSWSADGTQVVFNSDVDGSQQIYVMNADGSGRINLSNAKGYNLFPVWSTK